jgi:hypothetical protein
MLCGRSPARITAVRVGLHGDCKGRFGDGLDAEERRPGALAKQQIYEKRKSALSFPSVRPFAWNNAAPTGRIFMNLIYEAFSKVC